MRNKYVRQSDELAALMCKGRTFREAVEIVAQRESGATFHRQRMAALGRQPARGSPFGKLLVTMKDGER